MYTFSLRLIGLFCQPQMTGVVVDIGDGATHVVPVVDGYIIGSSIKSFPISGNDVTQFILQLLQVKFFSILLDHNVYIVTGCMHGSFEALLHTNVTESCSMIQMLINDFTICWNYQFPFLVPYGFRSSA